MQLSPEERQRRRERCLKNRPWEKSTGPKTEAGKLISSHNALKDGLNSSLPLVREVARLRQAEAIAAEQKAKIRELLAAHFDRSIQPPEALVQAIEQE